MPDDVHLLRRFVEQQSNDDFKELVRRNLPLVYHAARRRTGGRADLAEDVSQYVFTTLAQNAPKLAQHTALAGWLFTTTKLGAYRMLRDERRRREREQKFAAMTELLKPDAQTRWEKLRPELDALLDQLSGADREAVLLRYLQGYSLAEVGATLGLSPDSARKRIDRAVDRLRSVLIKRGLMTSTAVVAELLAAESVGAAPAQLAERLARAALEHSVPAASATAVAIGGSGLVLSTTAAIALAVATIGAGTGAVIWSHHVAASARAELASVEVAVRAKEAPLASLPDGGRNAAATPAGADPATSKEAGPHQTGRALPRSATDTAQQAADARANGARFLAAVPEARNRLTSFEKTQQRALFAGFYRAAGMSPEEISRFEQRVADYHLSSVELSGNRMVTTAGDLPVDQVRAMLGNDRGAIYEKYLSEIPARHLALEAAATVNYTTAPASPAQVDQLTHILSDANDGFHGTGRVDLSTENWPVALPRLQAIFTPEQWAAVEGLFLGQAYQQALHAAQAAALAESTVATTHAHTP